MSATVAVLDELAEVSLQFASLSNGISEQP